MVLATNRSEFVARQFKQTACSVAKWSSKYFRRFLVFSMEESSERLNPTRHRTKCCILAAIDLIWRIGDLSFSTVLMLFPRFRDRFKLSDSEVVDVKLMDDRVYDFILYPILTLLYFIAFFLQVSISIFLCKTCSGKPDPENERVACTIWSRIAFVSIIILFIRFFLPTAILTFINVAYNTFRVTFKSVGIYVVLQHERELRKYLDPLEIDNTRKEQSEDISSSARPSRSIEYSTPRSSFTASGLADINQSYVRPRVHRGMEYFEKKMYEEAHRELKAAKGYAPDDASIVILEDKLRKIIDIRKSAKRDYYAILGVPRTLPLDEIKRAFRRQSLRHHPDKHATDSETVQKEQSSIFLEIREAYEVLSDPKKRPEYDERLARDQERLREYENAFRNVYASYNSQFRSSIV